MTGPGDIVGDTLDGGNGDDVLRTRDGEADKITCGPGNDKAFLDTADVITDATAENANGSCEFVGRKAPKNERVALRGRAGEAGRRRRSPADTGDFDGPGPPAACRRPATESTGRELARCRSRCSGETNTVRLRLTPSS